MSEALITAEPDAVPQYQPLPEPAPAPEPASTFGSDEGSLRQAAHELRERRSFSTEAPVERHYHGSDGERLPDWNSENLNEDGNETPQFTVEPERAAHDLATHREAERTAEDVAADHELAQRIDAHRAEAMQALQQQLQPQPEAQPQDVPAVDQQQAAAPEDQSTPAPADPNDSLQRALQNDPALRMALEQELRRVGDAERAYHQQTAQHAMLAAEVVAARLPELRGVHASQIPQVIQAIAHSNPERAKAMVAEIQSLQQVGAQFQQQQQQQVEQFRAHQQAVRNQYDQAFDQWANKAGEMEAVARVKEALPEILRNDYGFSDGDLAELGRLALPVQYQRLLMDAARYRMAQKSIASPARPRSLPPVQRPGTRESVDPDNYGVSKANQEFLSKPTAKSGAQALTAARRARAAQQR